MNKTGTAIVSVIVGAALGYAAAKLTTPTCSENYYIQIDPNALSSALPDTCVYVSKGSPIIWQTKDRRTKIERIEFGLSSGPTVNPYPGAGPLDPSTPDTWFSGPLAKGLAPGTSIGYKVTLEGGGGTNIGHIIIR